MPSSSAPARRDDQVDGERARGALVGESVGGEPFATFEFQNAVEAAAFAHHYAARRAEAPDEDPAVAGELALNAAEEARFAANLAVANRRIGGLRWREERSTPGDAAEVRELRLSLERQTEALESLFLRDFGRPWRRP